MRRLLSLGSSWAPILHGAWTAVLMAVAFGAVVLASMLAGCAVPPPEAYATGGGLGRMDQALDLGQNEVGEGCVQSATGTAPGAVATTEVYCGAWQQPSGRVRAAGPMTEAGLATLASSGTWRSNLDANYLCGAPRPGSLGGITALELSCTRRSGGWPHVAYVALANGQAYLVDGVVSARPALARSVAVLSGRATAPVITGAAIQALQAQRQGARARATGDVREYDALMEQGRRANLNDDPSAAESAYSAALAVQEKALGRDNPNVADPAAHVALQLSNQGRFAEADALFARADALVPRATGDATLAPRVLLYEGLHASNQGRKEAALALMRRAEAGYLAAIPPDALRTRTAAAPRNAVDAALARVLDSNLQRPARIAILGLVETRRSQGVVLRELGRTAESDAALQAAADVAQTTGLEQPQIVARLSRSVAINASLENRRNIAISELGQSSRAFSQAFPGSRADALVGLLRGAELVQAGQPEAAVPDCRGSVRKLQEVKSGYEPERMAGCLDAFAAAAGKAGDPSARQALLRDMFLAAQLSRSSTTSAQIQQASARLAAGGGTAVGDAIREQQDAAARLAEIRRRRSQLLDAAGKGETPAGLKALDAEEAAAGAALAERESALQAAAPGYGQLVQQATSAEDILRLLRPGEAFVQVVLAPSGGWTFLLRDGAVQVGRVAGGAGAVDLLVQRIRRTMEPDTPTFDAAAANTLYRTLFGELDRGAGGSGLNGVKALTVAPSGSLLSLPFGILLTGPVGNPGDPAALAAAPWLVKRMAIGHVPSAGNFVSLRRVAGGSRASRPWFGFGDFRPVTLQQAQRSFPPSCGDSAELLAKIPPLPSARQELEVARRLLEGGTEDELLGPAFTAQAVGRANLSSYRVLHFATHAVLPSELKCQTEPALITSAPQGARDASGALLKASDLAQIKLDADVVILSACNSGGPDGKAGGGESLSTLARSFFYGGARSLLITHWEVSDQAATYLIADTLRRSKAQPGLGYAAALETAQSELLDRAGKSLPAEFAHPFFWAPFALIGQASLPTGSGQVASR